MPGGFENWSATLPRKPGVDYADLERLSTITVRGAGGGVAGEYRLDSVPRTSGDQMAVSPQAVGWQAHLDDDKFAGGIYRDIDLSKWQGPSSTRRVALLTADFPPGDDPSVAVDATTGLPALVLSITGAWVTPKIPAVDAWYDAGPGSQIASMYYDFAGQKDTTASFILVANSADGDDGPDETSADLFTALTGSGTYTPATPRRYVSWTWRFNATSAGFDGFVFACHLRSLAVYGNHGLTKRGTEPAAGFYASDIVTHAVQTFAPMLNIANGSVQQSSFVIPHLAFLEPTTCGEIVRQASRFDLPDWAVWENKTFWWTERGGQARRWRARIGPSELEETGQSVERLWESIVVQYQDVDGSTRTVGPPGSGADTESSDLKDSDPENPANKLGLTKRDLLQMGVSTAAGATEVGRRFLLETRLLDRSGRARAVGWIEDDRGALHPYWAPRAGDEIAFVDASDKSYRRIIRTEKDHDSRTVSFDLDAPPEGLAQLLERLGVVLVPLGIGS
jgi:hypothetical protein